MPRGALPKFDPAVDFSTQLVPPERLAPWNLERMFGRTGPLEVEIGSGKGLFLSQAGAACPDRLFLGIEVAQRYARFAAYRAAQAGLTNVRVVPSDVRPLLVDVLPTSGIEVLHVYFPDPWWKKRHHKRRIFQPDFVQHATRLLVPGGVVQLWTDVEEYFQRACEIVAAHSPLIGPEPVLDLSLGPPAPAEREDAPESPSSDSLTTAGPTAAPPFRTNRDRRVRLAGLTVYRGLFRKPREPKPDHENVPRG